MDLLPSPIPLPDTTTDSFLSPDQPPSRTPSSPFLQSPVDSLGHTDAPTPTNANEVEIRFTCNKRSGFIHSTLSSHVCRLHKALYGLRQTPCAWFNWFSSFLLRSGFTQAKSDSSMFVYRRHCQVLILLLYVDDIVVIGNSHTLLSSFISALSSEFAMKDLGDIHYFLGIQVLRISTGLFLSQDKYILDLLCRFGLHTLKSTRSPLACRISLSSTDDILLSDPTKFRSLGTSSFGISLRPSDIFLLEAYSDTDWTGCPDSTRSITDFAIYLGSNLISWQAKKQPTVSKSFTEAEYRAVAYTVADTLWIRSLLAELDFPLVKPVRLFCDNVSASYLVLNPVLHACTKHVAVDYYFVRERMSHGDLIVRYVPTHLQLADIFTKALSSDRFEFLRSNLGVHLPAQIEGDNR
ncbi:Retrovirus-related Pol polyprotein from transposon RE1-like protein, partial [Drosera capensis]